MTRALAVVAFLLIVVAACGDDGSGGGSAEPAAPVAPEPAPEVELSMEVQRLSDDVLDTSLTIVNGRTADVAVSDPTLGAAVDRSASALRIVSMRGEVEAGFSDALDAPPLSSGILVAAGQTLDLDLSLGIWRGDRQSVELCLEIVDTAEMTGGGDVVHGGEIDLHGREPGTPPQLACTGPVEISETE